MLEGPLSFHMSCCLYVQMYVYLCTDVGFLSTSKGKPSLSNEKAMTDFRQTWYVGSEGHKYYPCGLLSPNAHISYLICIPVLIGYNKKSNIQSSVMGYIDETWYMGPGGGGGHSNMKVTYKCLPENKNRGHSV